MDDNVMKVLQMLQEGKISAQEAEMLIASMRGAAAAEPEVAPAPKAESKKKTDFKIDLDNLGDSISRSVARLQPEKIVQRLQEQFKSASKAGAQWSSTFSSRIKTWADWGEVRPSNAGHLPEHEESHEHEFHLEEGAEISIENPLGNVLITPADAGSACVIVRKCGWAAKQEDAVTAASQMEVTIHGTDVRLDIKASAPDSFKEGTVDMELRVPRNLRSVHVRTRFGTVAVSGITAAVEVHSASGDITAARIDGDCRCETASGSVDVKEISGEANLVTTSGNITTASLKKGLVAHSASGDINVVGVENGRLEAKSVSGDVSVHDVGLAAPVEILCESISGDANITRANGALSLKAVSGDLCGSLLSSNSVRAQSVSGDIDLGIRQEFSGAVHVSTVSGDVKLAMPAGSSVRAALSTSQGDLKCEHDATDVTSSDTLWSGQLGNGTGTLNIQTISGDVIITKCAAETLL